MINTFIKNFTSLAHTHKISNLEFYTQNLNKSKLNIYEGQLDSYDLSLGSSCYIEGEYENYRGYVYIENFGEELYEENISKIKEIAKLLKEPFKAKEITNFKGETINLKINKEEFLTKLLEAEKVALEYDKRIDKIHRIIGEEVVETITIENDLGDKMQESIHYVNFSIDVAAKENDNTQTSEKYISECEISNIDFKTVAIKAAKEAVNLLGASPIKTGNYPVIIQNNVICEMLSTYLTVFAGDSVRKKLTRFASELGNLIGSDIVNLEEDPSLIYGIKKRSFDDEGTKTSKKSIIKDGILKNFLYNKDESAKIGITSTGNSFKPSYKTKAGINVTNLRLFGKSENTVDELLEKMQNGLYITSCDGMFAGADPVSGNFSLISKGYIVENGKKTKGVSQITIAGNFYDMLKNIKALGNDELQVGDIRGSYIAPSIYVKELVVSGL